MEDDRIENESMEDRVPSNAQNYPAARLRRRAMPILAAGLALAAAGCTAVAGPETETVRGILTVEAPAATAAASISADQEGPSEATDGSLEAPDQVQVGETFTATIRTVGLSGCWEPAGEDVTVDGLTATVVPFDSRGDRDVCTAALVFLDHAPQLAFQEPGEAVIRVEGRRVFGSDGAESEPMSLEATVTVVP